MNKLIVLAAIVAMASAVYGLYSVETAAREYSRANVEEVIYGHRIGPGGHEMILTTR